MQFCKEKAAHAVDVSTSGTWEQVLTGLSSATSVTESGPDVKAQTRRQNQECRARFGR